MMVRITFCNRSRARMLHRSSSCRSLLAAPCIAPALARARLVLLDPSCVELKLFRCANVTTNARKVLTACSSSCAGKRELTDPVQTRRGRGSREEESRRENDTREWQRRENSDRAVLYSSFRSPSYGPTCATCDAFNFRRIA